MMLTKKDLEKLKDKVDLKDFKKYGKNIYIYWRKCPFLDIKKGCGLPARLKPFDCKLFPLTFMFDKGMINLYLNKKCPYTKRIPKEWIDKTKKELLEELKDWTKEELETYTKIIEKHSSSKLKFLGSFKINFKFF